MTNLMFSLFGSFSIVAHLSSSMHNFCMMTLLDVDVDVVAMRAVTFMFFGIIEQSFETHSYSVLKSEPLPRRTVSVATGV